jgi:hypothetical protein
MTQITNIIGEKDRVRVFYALEGREYSQLFPSKTPAMEILAFVQAEAEKQKPIVSEEEVNALKRELLEREIKTKQQELLSLSSHR